MQLELHVCQCLTFLFDFHWVIILWQLHLTPFDSLTSSWLRSLKLSDAVECRTFSSNCLHLQVFVFWARKNRKFFGFGPTKKAKKRFSKLMLFFVVFQGIGSEVREFTHGLGFKGGMVGFGVKHLRTTCPWTGSEKHSRLSKCFPKCRCT